MSFKCLNCDCDHLKFSLDFLGLQPISLNGLSVILTFQAAEIPSPLCWQKALCSCVTIWDLTRNDAVENQASSSILSWAVSGGIPCSNLPLILLHLKEEVITESAHQEDLMDREVQFLVTFRISHHFQISQHYTCREHLFYGNSLLLSCLSAAGMSKKSQGKFCLQDLSNFFNYLQRQKLTSNTDFLGLCQYLWFFPTFCLWLRSSGTSFNTSLGRCPWELKGEHPTLFICCVHYLL